MSRQRDAHESYAVAAGTLHWSAAILAGSLLLVVLGMYELAQHWLHLQPAVPVATVPSQPRLQPHPARDIAAERAQQQARLDRYEWIDHRAGIARIPIARAMALMATQPAARSGSKQKQPPSKGLPLTPTLSPGKSAGGEGAKARGAVGYRGEPQSPLPRGFLWGEGAQRVRASLLAPSPSTASSLGERAGVRGRHLLLLGDRQHEQEPRKSLPLTLLRQAQDRPSLSPGKSAGVEGAERRTARMEVSP